MPLTVIEERGGRARASAPRAPSSDAAALLSLPPMFRRRLAVSLALAAAALVPLSTRLGQPQLHTDELTYMSVVLESIVQGRALPVQGTGIVFVNKPPLALWLMRGSVSLLGAGPWAARLPSVLAAAVTVVVLYLFAATFLGDAVGIVAALLFVLATGPLGEHGLRRATPDALEILLTTAAICCLELWRRWRRRPALVALAGMVAALAWVKSPFALAVILVYLLATEAAARRAGVGTPRLPGTFALLAGAWTLSYLAWLAVLSADSSAYSVARRLLVQQYWRRLQGRYGATPGTGYYLTTIGSDFGPLLLLPVAAAVVAWAAWRRSASPPAAGYGHDATCLLVWASTAPLLATLSVSKLPWYSYLSYPGIVLLVAFAAERIARAVSGRPAVRAAMLASVVAVAVWRLPRDLIWPASPQYRNLTGRLWEIVHAEPWVSVVAARDLPLPRELDPAREARFFARSMLWEQQRRRRPEGTTCVVELASSPPPSAPPVSVVQLYRPDRARAGPPLYLVDRCDGRVRDQLSTVVSR